MSAVMVNPLDVVKTRLHPIRASCHLDCFESNSTVVQGLRSSGFGAKLMLKSKDVAEITFNNLVLHIGIMGFIILLSFKYRKDASWSSTQLKAGIAWCLLKNRRHILQGSYSIYVINSPLEAEVETLRMAVSEVEKLGYKHVFFMGEASSPMLKI